MSFFGMGPLAGMTADPAKLAAAEVELDVLKAQLESMVDACRAKCHVRYYTEAELSKGESTCVDRCSAKFFKANMLIGEFMRAHNITADQLTAQSFVLPTLGQHGTLE